MERRTETESHLKSLYTTGRSSTSFTNSNTANVSGANVLELSHEANLAYNIAMDALHELICFSAAAAGAVTAQNTTSVNGGGRGVSDASDAFTVSVSSLVSAKKDVRDLALTVQLAFEAFVGAVASDNIRNKTRENSAARPPSSGVTKSLPSTSRGGDLNTGPSPLCGPSSISAMFNTTVTPNPSKCVPSFNRGSTKTRVYTKPKTIIFPWRKDNLITSTHKCSPTHNKLISFLPPSQRRQEPKEEDISTDNDSGQVTLTTSNGAGHTVPEPYHTESICTQQKVRIKQHSEMHTQSYNQQHSPTVKTTNALQALSNSTLSPSCSERSDIPTLVSRTVGLTFDALARLVGADEGAVLMAVPSDEGPLPYVAGDTASEHHDGVPLDSNKGLNSTFPSSISSRVINAQAICLFGTQRSPASVCVPLDHGVVSSVLRTGVALNISPEKPTPEYSNLLCFPIFSVEVRAEPIGVVLLERKFPTKITVSNQKMSSVLFQEASGTHMEGGRVTSSFTTPMPCKFLSSKIVPPLPFTSHEETLVQGFTSLAAELLSGYGVRHQNLQFDIFDYFKKDKSSVLGTYPQSSHPPRAPSHCCNSVSSSSDVFSMTAHSRRPHIKSSAYYHQLILSPYKPLPVSKSRTYRSEVVGVEVDLTSGCGDACRTRLNSRIKNKEMDVIADLLFDAIHHDRPIGVSNLGTCNSCINSPQSTTVIPEEVNNLVSTVARTAGTSDGTIEKLSFLVSKQSRVQLVLRSTHHSHFIRPNMKPLESTVAIAAQNVVDVTEYITSLEGCWKRSCDEVQELMSHQQSKSEDVRECRRQIRDLKNRLKLQESESAEIKERYERLKNDLEVACEIPL